jgi:tetratricopeptide (TPR) repeat protein
MQLWLDLGDPARLELSMDAIDSLDVLANTPAYAIRVQAAKAVVAYQSARLDESEAAFATATKLVEQLGPRSRSRLAQVRAFVAFQRGEAQASLLLLDESVASARQQSDPWLLLSALRIAGSGRIQANDHAGAVPLLTEAVALSTRLAGSENPHTAELQVRLAIAMRALGQIEAAHDLLTQARDSLVSTLGPDHPLTLGSVEQIARVLVDGGRPSEANLAYLDLLEVYGELYGPKDVRTAQIKLELGDTLMAMDEHDGARTMYLEALPPLVQDLGADHRDVIRCAIHLGIAEFALGHLDEAETHCTRGSDLVKALPKDDPLIAEVGRCVEQLAKARKKKRSR